MLLNFIGFFAVTGLLASCAGSTPAALADGAPYKVYTSGKSAQSIAECIAGAWENNKLIGGSPIASSRQMNTGFRVTLHMADRLRYMADVGASTTGSRTRIYVGNMTAAIGEHPAVEQAAKCQ